MIKEMVNNRISMDAVEQGSQSPQEFAIRSLTEQLAANKLDTAATAVETIKKAALNSENAGIRITAIRALSDFAAVDPETVGASRHGVLRATQCVARDGIAAISFGSFEQSVRIEAVKGLARGLDTPALEASEHSNIVQLIAIIGSTSDNNNVKNESIAALARYGNSESRGGYYGNTRHIEAQNYANQAVAAVVSKPVEATPGPVQ